MRKIHNEYREPVTRALDYMNSGQSGDFIQALFEIDQSGMKEALRYAGTAMNVTLGKQRPRSDREAFDLSVEVSDYFSVWGIPLVASRLQSGLSSIWRIGPVDGPGRKLGLRFIVGTQNVGQVRSSYGEDGANSVLSGFGTVFAFRLYDKGSREFVRGRYGSNRKVVRYDSVLKSRGVVEERVDGSVIEDWDLSELRVGKAVACLPDDPPVTFQFSPSFAWSAR